eukprot:GFYU01030189.1.p1 GENE.GFYU01030189.1~~GFYU01030189.1.p1  ORF type:complete len:187 (-),score=47.31 GFYU01030189.1:112-606(-)
MDDSAVTWYASHEDDSASLDLQKYLELKTVRDCDVDSDHFRCNFLYPTWIQSFLGGVPNIKVGFTQKGVVENVPTSYPTNVLPELCKESWDAAHVVKHSVQLLNFIKETATEEDTVYNVSYLARAGHIECRRVGPAKFDEVVPSEAAIEDIVPVWYYKQLHNVT